ARETRVLAIRGGVMSGRTVSAEEVESLATLPSLEVLRGQVLGAIIAPLTAIAGLINAPLQNLYGLLDARTEQPGGEPAAADDAPAASEEPTAAETEDTRSDATASD